MTRRLKHEWQNILRKKCKKYLQSLKKCFTYVGINELTNKAININTSLQRTTCTYHGKYI